MEIIIKCGRIYSIKHYTYPLTVSIIIYCIATHSPPLELMHPHYGYMYVIIRYHRMHLSSWTSKIIYIMLTNLFYDQLYLHQLNRLVHFCSNIHNTLQQHGRPIARSSGVMCPNYS